MRGQSAARHGARGRPECWPRWTTPGTMDMDQARVICHRPLLFTPPRARGGGGVRTPSVTTMTEAKAVSDPTGLPAKPGYLLCTTPGLGPDGGEEGEGAEVDGDGEQEELAAGRCRQRSRRWRSAARSRPSAAVRKGAGAKHSDRQWRIGKKITHRASSAMGDVALRRRGAAPPSARAWQVPFACTRSGLLTTSDSWNDTWSGGSPFA
jgi:hypothetical protein